jgi:2,5-furandicarboxylate decarboxylase 1
MTLREFLKTLKDDGELTVIKKGVDPNLEMASVLNALDGKAVVFENVKGSPLDIAGGVCSSRDYFAKAMDVKKNKLLFKIAKAMNEPEEPEIVGREEAPVQQVVKKKTKVDLDELPMLTHLARDGGPYITSGVVIVRDAKHGRNASIQRLMKIGKNRLVGRFIEERGTDTAIKNAEGKDLEVAISIGNSIPVLLAAATSPGFGVDEFSIANALQKTPLVKCVMKKLEVPAYSEIVLEGRITQEKVEEGPFLDLTNTYDITRDQNMVEIDCITHREIPLYQALLPGSLEHKLLMGIPQEAAIYNEVNEVCDCRNVVLTPGGGCWLHGVVQIKKRGGEDGKKAIQAALDAHKSMKHVLVVDDDIDIYSPHDLEWAVATRFQADRDMEVGPNSKGSSLDPSATHMRGEKSRTCKVGIDSTIPWDRDRQLFEKVGYKSINPDDYLD